MKIVLRVETGWCLKGRSVALDVFRTQPYPVSLTRLHDFQEFGTERNKCDGMYRQVLMYRSLLPFIVLSFGEEDYTCARRCTKKQYSKINQRWPLSMSTGSILG